MAETLGSVCADVLYQLGDDEGLIWSSSEVKDYIREGYDQMVRAALLLWDYEYSNDIAGQALYALPGDLMVIDRVTWNNRQIEPMTARELRDADSLYMSSTGVVLAYSVEDDGISYLRKWKVPAATPTAGQDTNNTRIEYFQRGSLLSDDLDEFDTPRWATKYVRFYALFRCFERKGKGQDLKMAAHYESRFIDGVERMKARKQSVNNARVARLGGSGRPYLRNPRPRLPWQYGKVVRWP